MMFPKPEFPWLNQTLEDLQKLAEQTQTQIAETMNALQERATQAQHNLEQQVHQTLEQVVPPEVQAAVATNHALVNQWVQKAQATVEGQMEPLQEFLNRLEQNRVGVSQQVTVHLQAVIPEPQRLQSIGGGMVGLMGGHVVGSALGGVAGAVTFGPVGAVIGTQMGGFTGRVVGAHLGETLAGGQPLETIDERLQRLASDYMGSSVGAAVGTVVGQVTLGPVGALVGNFVGDAVGGQLGTNVYQHIKQGQAQEDKLWAIDHSGETTSELIGGTVGRLVAGAQGQMYGARLGNYFGRKIPWHQAVAVPNTPQPDLPPDPELCYPKKGDSQN
ncbi:DUF456 domain-containing protein [Synechococcus sp. C9]|uniref:DUF456 domain-containing protein n=1 Tax=Synechococcus sp. C9 TaxID=102119 RepID=UPI001FF5799B|nr:DUF456 domain-containing protein [Synechococcus sp. C9]